MHEERAACACCGELHPIDLLDSKPNDPRNPDGCDWEVLECFQCYGPGWLPASPYQSRGRIDWLTSVRLWFRMKYRHWYFSDPKRKRLALVN